MKICLRLQPASAGSKTKRQNISYVFLSSSGKELKKFFANFLDII